MDVDKQKALLFGSAAALRLLLFTAFPSLPDVLAGRVELSTPVTSFKRLQEGLFLYNRNVSPFDGGTYHQSPLLLPLFSLLPNAQRYPLATSLLYVVADLVGADALMKIADTGVAVSSRLFTSSRRELRRSSTTIAAGYLFNPFIVLTCLARPTSVFTHTLILQATSRAATGQSITFILALALASYLSLYPLLLFPPLLILCYDAQSSAKPIQSTTSNALTFTIRYTSLFFATIVALLLLSYGLTSSWSFLNAHYLHIILLPSLTPNVGLWWYFFTEMFDSFRAFFLGVFWLHMFAYMPALSIRFRTQPLFVVCALLGVVSVYAPYPAVGEAGLFLSFLGAFRHVFPLMRYTFPAVSSLLYCTLLGPAFYHLWVYAGSGNANFFYAITLVWSLGLTVILADAIYAVLRDEWEVERPDMRGKEVRRV
ncbi:phosphatidylinositol glycan anchor biosynthesis class U protein [Rhizodiscina lignyota]|uniref:Phosphatidylinositol glycan anchor biosynthesis class U protein n=1 Tax=Rhizodiscina lignyota TaxID=1504668 RepID=A0A9P4M9U4_9PEZI|nr:phosphatidylinositol glycan anchor biosynthesis class U protein [Rhizodiscina lignyota]